MTFNWCQTWASVSWSAPDLTARTEYLFRHFLSPLWLFLLHEIPDWGVVYITDTSLVPLEWYHRQGQLSSPQSLCWLSQTRENWNDREMSWCWLCWLWWPQARVKSRQFLRPRKTWHGYSHLALPGRSWNTKHIQPSPVVLTREGTTCPGPEGRHTRLWLCEEAGGGDGGCGGHIVSYICV